MRSELRCTASSLKEKHVSAHDELGRINYWTAGRYRLQMTVSTSRPDQASEEEWRFVLTGAHADRLRLNSLKILRDACAIPPPTWPEFNVTVDYEDLA